MKLIIKIIIENHDSQIRVEPTASTPRIDTHNIELPSSIRIFCM